MRDSDSLFPLPHSSVSASVLGREREQTRIDFTTGWRKKIFAQFFLTNDSFNITRKMSYFYFRECFFGTLCFQSPSPPPPLFHRSGIFAKCRWTETELGRHERSFPSLSFPVCSLHPYIELESEAASATSSSSSSRIGMEKRRVWRADQGRVWSRYSSASGHGKEGFSSTQRLALVTAARACINLEIHQMHKQKNLVKFFGLRHVCVWSGIQCRLRVMKSVCN